jgi:hypothetical protein
MNESTEDSGMGTAADDASAPRLVDDIHVIVRDLHYKNLAGMLMPIDESVRRVLEACLRRGLDSGDASPEERALAAELGVTATRNED